MAYGWYKLSRLHTIRTKAPASAAQRKLRVDEVVAMVTRARTSNVMIRVYVPSLNQDSRITGRSVRFLQPQQGA